MILDPIYLESDPTEAPNRAAHVGMKSVLYVVVNKRLPAFRSKYDVIEKICV